MTPDVRGGEGGPSERNLGGRCLIGDEPGSDQGRAGAGKISHRERQQVREGGICTEAQPERIRHDGERQIQRKGLWIMPAGTTLMQKLPINPAEAELARRHFPQLLRDQDSFTLHRAPRGHLKIEAKL
jgi:hypothetical protein